MDPITHGLLGAAVVQATLKIRMPRGAAWIGAAGAMLPDIDVFIYSFSDPTVSWLFHRHFTHSLAFIPIGGLIAGCAHRRRAATIGLSGETGTAGKNL